MAALSKAVPSLKPLIEEVCIKKVGKGEAAVNIKTAYLDVLKMICASELSTNVHFRVKMPGGTYRHMSLCYFKHNGTTTYEQRLELVMELRAMDFSDLEIRVVGASAFGKPASMFVVFICHLGRHHQWFQEIRMRGDVEWFGEYPICHISTCWGWDCEEEKLALRGEDVFTDEHAWSLAMLVQIGDDNFVVAGDDILLGRFNQISMRG